MTTHYPHISKTQIKWVRSLQQKKVRDAEGVFVAEGDKCIGELMGAFELVLLITYTKSPTRSHLHEVTYTKLYSASEAEIEQMSSLRTPQGSIAVFRQPSHSVPTAQRSNSASGLLLALDGIQDPGNLGTIIRTCDWFGVRDIYCSRETADCFSPKVVQATMGALGRVQVHYLDLPEWISREAQSGTPIYGTLLDGRNMYEEGAIPSPERGIIVMGNEGNGITPEVRALLTHPLYIPAYAERPDTVHVESLNVGIATAIILAEFRRRI